MAILAAQPESGFSSDFLRDYEAAQQRVKQVKSAEPLIISELMAANDGSLRDADGDASDWIEIYNAGTNTVNLTGWRLTADPANLGQWIFPSTDLGPDRFLLVFASGKNRAIAGRELHTSFRLDAAGRYLALVEPDGQTIAYQFAPAYPAQVQGVSYGVEISTTSQPFVVSGAVARWIAPTGPADMPAGWTATDFDHVAWSVGQTGLGYSSGLSNAPPPGGGTNLTRGRPTTQSSTLGSFTSSLGVNGNFADFTHTQAGQYLPAQWQVNLGTNYALTRIVLYNRTDCCGSRLRDITVEILATNTGGLITNYTSALLNPENRGYTYPNGPATITSDLMALTGGAVAGQIVRVRRTPDPDLSGTGGQGTSSEADVLALAEVEVFGGTGDPLGGLIRTDLTGSMQGHNATLLVRIPFGIPVEEMPALDRLTLRLKYDDGFVAYLNGIEIARRNAPATPFWNSTATAEHSLPGALQFEEIDVSAFIGQLREGQNELAIQGLNLTASDGDFLLVPELVGKTPPILSVGYFAQPTPGAANTASYLGLVADTKFSVDRGLFTAPFTVVLSTATAGAEIHYTTNGSLPSTVSGLLYTGPIPISRTTVLRAIATKPGYRPSDVDTQTYVFPSNAVTQSAQTALNAGFPSTWAGAAADYAMDPRITVTYASRMDASLRSLSSVFVTTSVSNLFDANNGIYSHPTSAGVAWERPASLEMINTNGASEFQVNCGLRIQGGYFRNPGVTHKHSLRVLFKSEYGPGKLRHHLFEEPDAAQEFDTLVLRAGANDGYSWADAKDTEQFIRDEFGRRLQLDTGHPAPHGRFVHLYLNGIYWGLYNLVERPNEDFSASYFGGQPEEWDANNAGNIMNGDLQAWNNFLNLVRNPATLANYEKLQGLDPNGTRNLAFPIYLDASNYIDYMIVNIWGGNWDWPNKNFWFGRQRTSTSTGFKFYLWDFENTMGNNLARSPINMVAPRAGLESSWVAAPHYYLKNNPEYRLDFADRVHQCFFNGGLLTPQVLANRYRALADQVEAAIVCESARWGDDNLNPPQDLADWLRERDWILGTYLKGRSDIVLQQFRNAGLYPSVSAPVFSQYGGVITNGFLLTLSHSNTSGTIYYTLDGTDPRLIGGDVNGAALAYNNAVQLSGSTRVKARVRSGVTWSALTQADFLWSDVISLRITELMYHPAPLGSAEIAAGFTNAEDFEFIELRNVGAAPVSLIGVHFDKGITFSFTGGILAAGERLLLVKNRAAFATRYGSSIPIAGVYSGNLDDAGERLRLRDAADRTVLDFSYSDGWYPTTDGFGFSLVVLDDSAPASTLASKASWRASSAVGGSPGGPDPAPPGFPRVLVNELLSRPPPGAKAAVELANLGDSPADVTGWWLTDEFRVPQKFRLPPATIIPPGGFVVFTEAGFGPAALGTNALTFSAGGGEVRLFSADAAGELTGYCQGWNYGAEEEGVSFGRYVTSTGADHFVAQASTTLGGSNASPRVGPVVITELMYHPPDGPGGLDNTRDEFIEIANVTSNALSLFAPESPNYTWQLEGGVRFVFPTGLSLAAGERLLLVSFDPAADPGALADFGRLYAVPQGIRVFGPYGGKLNNDTDGVELMKPTLFPVGVGAAVLVDKVSYHDSEPWPEAADGLGASLHRRDVLAYGDDSANWAAYAGRGEVRLGIGLTSTDVLLWWPEAAGGWALEQSGQLGAGAGWLPYAATNELKGGQWQTVVPTSAATNRFFRLRHP